MGEDEYLFDATDAAGAFEHVDRPVCLFGHTHLPMVFMRARRRQFAAAPDPDEAVSVAIEPDALYLINPGSVGQPRDGDARAAFAFVDDEAGEVELRRVPYAIEGASRAILAAGLPPALAHRLAVGRDSSELPNADCRLPIAAQPAFCSSAFGLPLLALFAAAELGGVGVGRRARAEDPADDDAHDEHRGNVDEVGRGDLAHHALRWAASIRRATSASSRSTLPSRRQIDQT